MTTRRPPDPVAVRFVPWSTVPKKAPPPRPPLGPVEREVSRLLADATIQLIREKVAGSPATTNDAA